MGWFVDCEDLEFLQILHEDIQKVIQEGDPILSALYANLSRSVSAIIEQLDPWSPV
jgi:hypothetical protein